MSASYQWSDLVRVDVLSAAPTTAFAFYGPASMLVTAGPLAVASSTALSSTALPSISSALTPGQPLGSARGMPAAAQADSGQQGREIFGAVGASRILSCTASVAARGGLVPHALTVKTDGSRGALADIAVSGEVLQ